MKIRKKKAAARPAPARPQEKEERRGAAVHQRSIGDVIREDTIPYHFWREWLKARERNDHPLLHAMSAEGGALREAFGPFEGFAEQVRRNRSSVPGMRVSDLWRITVNDQDEAAIIASEGHRDRTLATYLAERWELKREGEQGWRLLRIERADIPRSVDPTTLRESHFGASQK